MIRVEYIGILGVRLGMPISVFIQSKRTVVSAFT